MSEITINIKLKNNKSKQIKGKLLMSNKNEILSDNKNKIIGNIESKEFNIIKANSKSKQIVKPRNNNSFILKRKNKKDNFNLSFKILTHRSTSKNKNSKNHKFKTILKPERKNQFHTRIKSFQFNEQNKDYLYKKNHYINNQKNIINKKKRFINDETDDNNTKNTKISEQKDLNSENYNNYNELLITGNKNNHIRKNSVLVNKSIIIKNEKINNDSNANKLRVSKKSKTNSRKKSSFSKEKNGNLTLVNNSLHVYKKESKNKKKIINIVNTIKEKIYSGYNTLHKNDFNTTKYLSNKTISFDKYIKTVSFEKNSMKSKGINNIRIKNKIIKTKFQKSSLNCLGNNNKSKEFINFDISSLPPSIIYKKRNYKNKIKLLKKSNRNKNDLIKNKNISNDNFIYNSFNTFHQDNKKKNLNGNRSPKNINSDFYEQSMINGKNNNLNYILKHEKNQKKKCQKEIENIESLCHKGFFGRNIEKINQDNFFIYKNFINNPNYIFMGVCDGHGAFGHEVSRYLVYNMPLVLNNLLIKKKLQKNNLSEIIPLLKDTFIQIDKTISKETDINTLFSGSTCVSLIFTPSKLLCANVGDSRCIIGKSDEKKWFSKDLSIDHKPENKSEKERILKYGGRIEAFIDEKGEYYGPQRVWLKEEDIPGLAMSRSFGDIVAHRIGVISEPEVIEYSFSEEDKFIILASDGIWEYISSEECVDIVKDYFINKDLKGAVHFLYKEASKRWIIKEEVIVNNL